ncbi:hypothetical protein ACTOB_000302 [Actinoplanes oblitus]|uniref:Uncharacterized protein n=1 Tax=Actinoplanes oblitus TaxID=3040509 RepID=A0ABY8WG21_9ACTN|nr:hypothetical protein [Actinoplanes oblitus]WIM96831.1 hypothetical protein ACTOB_000302 [Actinoplanes oblitus]
MRLTFLGKETQGGGSPTLYETDRGTCVVQGWKVPGEPATTVEIPESLLQHLRPDTVLAERLEPTGRTWRGDSGESATFNISGADLEDEILTHLNVPDHESCVEVGLRRKGG